MTDIYCIHPKVKDIESFLDLTCLKDHIEPDSLKWNPENPSILIVTEWVYYRKDLFTKFKDLYEKAGLKIAWMGEAISADLNLFDYWIGFDCDRDDDPRFIRLLSPLDMFHRFISSKENEPKDKFAADMVFSQKSGFCNFLYSNAHAHHMRDDLFYALNRYKKVDSLGKHLNNVAIPGTGYTGHASECVTLKSPYKFSIAAENACYNGYTSEKIITSLLAHTVPIYWGNPSVGMDVNPECFINVSDYENLNAVVNKVKEIDNNPDMWHEIISKPWFTQEQVDYHKLRSEKYYKKMSFILSGDAPKMAPEGYHIDLYRSNFFNGEYPFDRSLCKKTISRICHFLLRP